MRSFFLIVFLSFGTWVNGQSPMTLIEALQRLQEEKEVKVFYQEEYVEARNVSPDFNSGSASDILDVLLENSGLSFVNYRDYVFVVAPASQVNRNYDEAYYSDKQIAQSSSAGSIQLETLEIGRSEDFDPGKDVVLTGFITDESTEEPLIGATLKVEESGEGVITNEIGQYVLNLGIGEHTLKINSVGFEEKALKVRLFSTGELDIDLLKEAVQLDEVVISAEGQNQNIRRNEAGLEVLSVQEIKKLPAFLGEVDVVKSLLLLPGVSTVGEGSGGFNVRGGTVDQNLIMQDGMYLFNSSHVLGLFSLFNPDIVKSVNLYKGSMPAKYGGRLSSVLDVELREGNYQKFTGKGGIGFVSSRLTLESPISKGNSSVLFGARTSYSDWIFDVVNVADIRESSAFFYDTNIKFTQRFENKGKLFVSGYLSRDRFKFTDEFDFDWRTKGVNASFNWIFNDRLSLAVEGVFSRYNSQWDEPSGPRAFQLKSDIKYAKFRPEVIINLNEQQDISIGAEVNRYTVNPGEIAPVTQESTTVAERVEEENARDLAVYFNDDIALNDNITLSAGLRYAFYQALGPDEVVQYEPGVPRTLQTQVGSESFSDGEVVKTYSGFEPRASLNLGINDKSSVKMSYSRTQQFINQISNTTAVSPVDVWQLSNTYIEPQRAHNYSLGYFRNFDQDNWETSLEVFYRDIDNLIEYKDLADLLVNQQLETELLSGMGRSYGVELSVKKKAGRWNGWFGYTYSRTERKTDGTFLEESINNNEWFLSNYDKPHDLSLALSYQTSKRTFFSVNFVYSSGRPTTAPVGSFTVDNAFNIPFYSERNTFRIPDYHRLDVSYTIEQSHRRNQAWRSSFTISLFNVYGRKNAFTVFFTQAAFQNPKTNRLAILGSAFPSVTYNFSF